MAFSAVDSPTGEAVYQADLSDKQPQCSSAYVSLNLGLRLWVILSRLYRAEVVRSPARRRSG